MRNLIILFICLLLGSLGHIATDIYLPSMPDMATHFATTASMMQVTLTVYMVSFCATPIIIGPISDSIGRKKPILLGIYIAFISTLLCILATNIEMIIIGRFLQGVGLGTIVCVSRALLPDHFQGRELAKNYSYLTILTPFVLAIAPPLGGFIQEYLGWQAVFGFILIYLVLIRQIVVYVLKDNASIHINAQTIAKTEIRFKLYLHAYKGLFANRTYLKYSLCSVVNFMGVIAYLTWSPFYFQEIMGLSPVEYGLLSLILCATTASAGFINSKLIHRFQSRQLLYTINMFMIVSGALLIYLHHSGNSTLLFSMIAVCLYFLTIPMSFANSASLALSNVQGNFGAATALMIGMQYCGGSLGSLIMSFANKATLLPLGILFIGVGVLYRIVLSLPEKTIALQVNTKELKSSE